MKAYLALVLEAIDSSKSTKRNGVSRQFITNYLMENYLKEVPDPRRFYGRVRLALRRGVDNGVLVQTKQSFRRNKDLKETKSKKKNKEVKLGGKVFEVEKILKEKSEDSKKQYLVKWHGYPKSESTWEPAKNILTPILIQEWEDKKGTKAKSKPKLKPKKPAAKKSTKKRKIAVKKTSSVKKATIKKAAKKTKSAKARKKGKAETKSKYIEEVSPVDEDKVEDECPLKGHSKVYSDASGFYTATLQSASRLERQAKFYIIQLLKGKDKKYHVWTRWGRVGLSGVSKMMGPYNSDGEAKKAFGEKFKKKTGNAWNKRDKFTPQPGKYTLMGHDGADEAEEGAGNYDEMMARFRNHPNEGRELAAQADEKDGERVTSVRTHKWQYYVDDGVDGKSTNWYDYDLEASDVVDFAFKDWRRNPAVNVRAIKSGTYTYSVNFNKMEQTNIEHHNHTKRAIRRVVFKALKRAGSFLGFE
mmetsp:Transcript_34267/g.66757  ORF Transcript_34267/g.66757 Transcript_34267/m.66757 type:complete len:472 (-) Transcript_34267:199-1614(-)